MSFLVSLKATSAIFKKENVKITVSDFEDFNVFTCYNHIKHF